MKKYKINISKEPHRCDLENIGSVFVPLMKKALSSEELVCIDIIINWKEIVGDQLASFCRPIKTKFNPKDNQRTLFLEVPTGAFAVEVQHKESYIINKINAYFGYQTLHKINITQNMNMLQKPIVASEPISESIDITEEEKQVLSKITSEIKDEKLRKILTKLGKDVLLSKKEKTKC